MQVLTSIYQISQRSRTQASRDHPEWLSFLVFNCSGGAVQQDSGTWDFCCGIWIGECRRKHWNRLLCRCCITSPVALVSTKYYRETPSTSGLDWVCREGGIITESFGEEGASRHLQIDLVLKVKSTLSRLLRALSGWVLKTCKDRDFSCSGKTVPNVWFSSSWNLFFISNWNCILRY